ncbi:unnamed protein product [Arabidopsis thaliana]|uniref:(thale cress) hypothetical protein n=1 Tax=Arabidopsis thaliana TaxID=3702 RepID=A0A7G2EPH8_ARATH|nr:unnamed protein product [Arabidopsis thaliana]
MFATKDKTPSVLVTSEVGLQFYLKTLRENRGLNLFVKFEEKVDTPNLSCKHKEVVLNGKLKVYDEFMDALHDAEEKIARSGGLKSNEDVIVDDEDDIFVDDLFVDNKTEDTKDGIDIFDDTLPGGGYDKEFGGGVDVRYKGKNNKDVSFQGLNDKVGISADKVVKCTSSGVFDHAVFVSGGGSGVNAEKVKTEWAAKTNVGCRAGSSHGLRSGARMLEEIDDEEFDIPPLFEDIEYEVEKIPDLDIEDDGKGIYKGKVYASKEDCQIGLAIYAIKNMFHFKQTRTKWNYFVLSCSDEKCDWRILATLMKGTGYYEIKKASLDHTCSLDTTGQFMQKATSKVIASVFKAKYSDLTSGPVPMDLQQLVLEDLRVSASYSKCWRARESALTSVAGSDEELYYYLAEYLHLLKLTNPGTITHIETKRDVEDESKERDSQECRRKGTSR